jgi:hypothetical protein
VERERSTLYRHELLKNQMDVVLIKTLHGRPHRYGIHGVPVGPLAYTAFHDGYTIAVQGIIPHQRLFVLPSNSFS